MVHNYATRIVFKSAKIIPVMAFSVLIVGKKYNWKEWLSAASKLRVAQVKDQITMQATATFDFLSLVFIASVLAGIGLITNNTVVIVASMLVSPIMGPVLALTFGSTIRDFKMVKLGLRVEAIALGFCLIIGAGLGLGVGALGGVGVLGESDTWPTGERSVTRQEVTESVDIGFSKLDTVVSLVMRMRIIL